MVAIFSGPPPACLHEPVPSVYKWRMNPTKLKNDFFRRIADFRPFQQLVDLLPDVAVGDSVLFHAGVALARVQEEGLEAGDNRAQEG